MSAEKRSAPDNFSSHQLVKRQKSDANLNSNSSIAVVNGTAQNGALIQSVPRTSGLQAPVMELSGHGGEVYACRFDPTGNYIASASMDRNIFLWRTYGDCENYGQLTGHKGAVLDLHWSRDARTLFSASADMTLASWDVENGQRIRRHIGHEDVINCMDLSKRGEEIAVTGSDDGSVAIWDPRQKEAIAYLETDYPVTAVAIAEAGNEIYSGSIDNDVRVWDLRKQAVAYSLLGHTDTITSLQVSPDSQYLLSNSLDATVRTWDIRPFAPADRQVKVYDGAATGMDKNLFKASWDTEGKRIAAGGGDRTAVVWDVMTGKMLYKLPGHKGAVNDVRFSPQESTILLSGSSDQTLLLGELGK